MQIIKKQAFMHNVLYTMIILYTSCYAYSAEINTNSQTTANAQRYVSVPITDTLGVSFEWHNGMTIEQLKNQYAQFRGLSPQELIVSETPSTFTDNNNSAPQKISDSALIPLEKTHYAQETKTYAYFIIHPQSVQTTLPAPANTHPQQPTRTTYLEKGKKALQWVKDNPKIVAGTAATIIGTGMLMRSSKKNTRDLDSESKNDALDNSQPLTATEKEKKEDVLPPYTEKAEELPAYEDISHNQLPTYEELYPNK